MDRLRAGLSTYHITLSSMSPLQPTKNDNYKYKIRDNYSKARAGVILAIHKSLIPEGCDITRHPTPPELCGYYTSVTIAPKYGPTTYLATAYICPSDNQLRNHIYSHINKSISNKHTHHTQGIIGGDWNAALHPTDRCCNMMSHTDTMHNKFTVENRLSPLAPRHNTESFFTYFSETDKINASRIDDAYYFVNQDPNTPAPPVTTTPNHGMTERILLSDGGSDHRPLLHTVPGNSSLNLPRYDDNNITPPDNTCYKQKNMRFKPITQEAKNTARLTLAADMGPLAHTTYKNTSTAREIMMQALDGNHSPQNRVAAKDTLTRANITIDKLADEVIGAIHTCNKTIQDKQIFEKIQINCKGKGRMTPRKLSGEIRKCADTKKATQSAMAHVLHAKYEATLQFKNRSDAPSSGHDTISLIKNEENYIHAYMVEQWPTTISKISKTIKNLNSKICKKQDHTIKTPGNYVDTPPTSPDDRHNNKLLPTPPPDPSLDTVT